MDISDSEEYKNNSLTIYAHGMAGYVFYSNRRGTCGIGGVLFLIGRGIGGILAGYLNYWRPNLPKYVIRQLSNFIKIDFEYHTVFRAVKYWAI